MKRSSSTVNSFTSWKSSSLVLDIVFPSRMWYMIIISKREMFVKDQKVISDQTYLDYLAWCSQARIASRAILSEEEYLRQVSSLPTTSEASARSASD
jgi:hypothetical protein